MKGLIRSMEQGAVDAERRVAQAEADVKRAKAERNALLEAARILKGDPTSQARRSRIRREIDQEAKLLLDPHKQAGQENISRVEGYLSRMGTAYQSAIRKDLGMASGADTWTLRALALDGKVRVTGRSFHGSKEFAYVPQAEIVVEAGRGVRDAPPLEVVGR